MGYCDYTDAWLRDLTRQRRAELKAKRAAERAEPIRYAGRSSEFHREIDPNVAYEVFVEKPMRPHFAFML